MSCDGPGSGGYQNKLLWTKMSGYTDTRCVVTGAGMDENVRHPVAMIKNNFDPSLYQKGARIHKHGMKKVGLMRTLTPTSSLSSITPQLLQQEIIRRGRRGQAPPLTEEHIGKPASKGRPLTVTRVNLIGWSRGAVTCLMIANAIAEDSDIKKLPLNIFASIWFPEA